MPLYGVMSAPFRDSVRLQLSVSAGSDPCLRINMFVYVVTSSNKVR
jgi:hypothetical protein